MKYVLVLCVPTAHASARVRSSDHLVRVRETQVRVRVPLRKRTGDVRARFARSRAEEHHADAGAGPTWCWRRRVTTAGSGRGRRRLRRPTSSRSAPRSRGGWSRARSRPPPRPRASSTGRPRCAPTRPMPGPHAARRMSARSPERAPSPCRPAITCAPFTFAQTAGFAAGAVWRAPTAVVDGSVGALKSVLLEHAAAARLSPIATSATPVIPPRRRPMPMLLMPSVSNAHVTVGPRKCDVQMSERRGTTRIVACDARRSTAFLATDGDIGLRAEPVASRQPNSWAVPDDGPHTTSRRGARDRW